MSLVWDNGQLVEEDALFADVGPQVDGTYTVPSTAEPVNDPSNTAGYPAASDGSALDILKYGVGVITDTWKFGQQLDYKRWEATQGGLYRQGSPASTLRVGSTGAGSSNFLLIAAAAVVAVLLLTQRHG